MAHLAVSPWGFGYIPKNSCEQPQIPVLQLPSCAFGINQYNRAIKCKGNAWKERIQWEETSSQYAPVLFQCIWCIVSFFIILLKSWLKVRYRHHFWLVNKFPFPELVNHRIIKFGISFSISTMFYTVRCSFSDHGRKGYIVKQFLSWITTLDTYLTFVPLCFLICYHISWSKFSEV